MTGSRLVLPLTPLVQPTLRRTLHLDDTAPGVASWSAAVRAAEEPCLLLDVRERVVALSEACAAVLEVQPATAVGALLVDLVTMIDFSVVGLPLNDAENPCPPLRALRTGGMCRALVRLRLSGGRVATYDGVGVPLAGGVGALGFFLDV